MKTKIVKVILAWILEATIIAILIACEISSGNRSNAYDAAEADQAEVTAFVNTTLDG